MSFGETLASVIVLLVNSGASIWLICEHMSSKDNLAHCGVAAVAVAAVIGWILFVCKVSDD